MVYIAMVRHRRNDVCAMQIQNDFVISVHLPAPPYALPVHAVAHGDRDAHVHGREREAQGGLK